MQEVLQPTDEEDMKTDQPDRTLKCTAEFTKLVLVELRGQKHPKGGYYRPNDGGLYGRYLKWSTDNKIYSERTLESGGGVMIGLFSPEDALKVAEWLRTEEPHVEQDLSGMLED